ncbi:MAG: DNA polymerase domain-containing protein, partial [Thermoplasmata archaeon]
CHEAINAYARELLVEVAEEVRRRGWSVLHGIVDSLWLRPPTGGADPEALAREISGATGLPLGYEGRYRWIVFLPHHEHGFGVPQRYYGAYESGELKVRGLEVRRGDACAFVRGVQQEVLTLLAEAPDADGFRARIPEALERGRAAARRLVGGTVPREELIVTRRASRSPEEYRVFSDGVAAMRQLRAHGIDRGQGEEVGYVITDRRARDWRRKVVAAELIRGDEAYDAEAYVELLARSFETLFRPFGGTVDRILRRWGISPTGPGYRPTERASAQRPGQRRLMAAG